MGIVVIAYLIALLLVLIAGGAGIYHGLKFGLPGDRTRLGIFAYLIAVAVIIVASFIVIGSVSVTGGA